MAIPDDLRDLSDRELFVLLLGRLDILDAELAHVHARLNAIEERPFPVYRGTYVRSGMVLTPDP